MPSFAILHPDLTVKEVVQLPELPPHKPGRILPIVEDAPPSPVPLSKKVCPGALVVESDHVRQTWALVDKTPDEYHESLLSLGYYDTELDIHLKTTRSAQQAFTGQMAVVQLALQSEQITESSPITVWDSEDAPRTLTCAEYTGLMLRYGQYVQSLFSEAFSQ